MPYPEATPQKEARRAGERGGHEQALPHHRSRGAGLGQGSTQADSLQRALSALWAVPADCDGSTWVRVLSAALQEGISADQLQAWSEQDARFDLSEFRQALRSARKMRRVTGATLYWLARQHGWQDDTRHRPTREQIERQQAQAREQQRRIEAQQIAGWLQASDRALMRWSAAESVPGRHPYLDRKRLQDAACFLRQDSEGCLLVPLQDERGVLWSLQRIAVDGGKRFLAGSRVKGCFARLFGDLDRLALVEGWATGAAVWLASERTTICAMSAGNLTEVARALARVGHVPPDTVVVADHDANRTGERAAREAAKLLGCGWTMPEVEGEDAADMWLSGGAEAVHQLLQGVRHD